MKPYLLVEPCAFETALLRGKVSMVSIGISYVNITLLTRVFFKLRGKSKIQYPFPSVA